MGQPLWRIVWRFLKKLKIWLSYDPATTLLGIYLEKTIIQKDTCTPMFITALFMAKTRRQPKHSLTDEWIRKMWCVCVCLCVYTHIHTYNGLLLSHKKNEILPFAATWIDRDIIILSEVSQTKENTISFIHGI